MKNKENKGAGAAAYGKRRKKRGVFSKKKYSNFLFREASKNLKKLMKRRGPNQQGSFEYISSNCSINLFSSRLSIIDLDNRSNQPFKSNDLILIFNGEIYNYLEIREYLKKKQIKFNTNSDTEVLLKSYKYWGEKCVEYFDGMWAFCIYDYKKSKIFLSRDNFGEKPLFYYLDTITSWDIDFQEDFDFCEMIYKTRNN